MPATTSIVLPFARLLPDRQGLWLLLLWPVLLPAQFNLVPNAGFDTLTYCPTTPGQIILAKPWNTVEYTPDIFHECAIAANFQVPHPFGCEYLPAHNGPAYAGIYVYGGHETLSNALSRPLERGRAYYVRMFVAPDEDCQPGLPRNFSDGIGLRLKQGGDFKIVVEQERGQTLRDTARWTKLSACYYAQGGEQAILIGNPHYDAETLYESDQPDEPYPYNYMYVDDVFFGTFAPLPDTVLLCDGQPMALNATFLEATYQWTTGDTTATVMIADTGRYVVRASLDGCTFYDTVVVIDLRNPPASLGDSLLCQEDGQLVLTAPLPGRYRWSDGSTGAQLTVREPGEYSLTVTNECGEFSYTHPVAAEDCRCRIFVPNAFSPNADGSHDALDLSIGCDYPFDVQRFEIFDRWGERVFAAKGYPATGWDGLFQGKPAPSGVYFWQLRYTLTRGGATRTLDEHGDVTLLR